MRSRDARKAPKQLRRRCNANGIDLIVVPEHGKGSHSGLLFRDRKTGGKLHIVISGDKEISPFRTSPRTPRRVALPMLIGRAALFMLLVPRGTFRKRAIWPAGEESG